MNGQNFGGMPFTGPGASTWDSLQRLNDFRQQDGGGFGRFGGFQGGGGGGLGIGAPPPPQAPQGLPPALAAYFAQVNRPNNQAPFGGGHMGMPYDPNMSVGTGGGLPPQGMPPPPMSGGLPPQMGMPPQGLPPMMTGGGHQPQGLPQMGMGGGLPPRGLPPMMMGGGMPPQGGGMQPPMQARVGRGPRTRRNLGFGAMQ